MTATDPMFFAGEGVPGPGTPRKGSRGRSPKPEAEHYVQNQRQGDGLGSEGKGDFKAAHGKSELRAVTVAGPQR